jgi:hypothetical protein
MPLTTAEHRQVQAETRAVRNAMARHRLRAHRHARQWCAFFGATVTPWRTVTGALRYTVKVAGFAAVTEPTLAWAVARLDDTIARFCESPARTSNTGRKLDPLRVTRAQWEEARSGD